MPRYALVLSATQAKHQTKYVQNFYARSVVFHVGGAERSLATKKQVMMQLIVTAVVFYVIIRAIDGLSLMLGGRGDAEKSRRDENHRASGPL